MKRCSHGFFFSFLISPSALFSFRLKRFHLFSNFFLLFTLLFHRLKTFSLADGQTCAAAKWLNSKWTKKERNWSKKKQEHRIYQTSTNKLFHWRVNWFFTRVDKLSMQRENALNVEKWSRQLIVSPIYIQCFHRCTMQRNQAILFDRMRVSHQFRCISK